MDAKLFAMRDTVLNMIKDAFQNEMHLDVDDSEIMDMTTKNLPKTAKQKLSTDWGPIRDNPELAQEVRNGDLPIKDLIDRLAGLSSNPQPLPKKQAVPGIGEASTWLEADMTSHDFSALLFEVKNDRQGSHGRGGTSERPAANCLSGAEWEFHFQKWPHSVEKMLVGHNVYVEDRSYRSYHECSLSIRAYILVNSINLASVLENLIPYSKPDAIGRGLSYTFPFKNYKDAVINGSKSKLGQVEFPGKIGRKSLPKVKGIDIHPHQPLPGESGYEYWQRLMDKAKSEINAKRPRKYEGD